MPFINDEVDHNVRNSILGIVSEMKKIAKSLMMIESYLLRMDKAVAKAIKTLNEG